MKKETIFSLLILVLLLVTTVDAKAQCAMCKAVLESEDDADKLSGGINNGIMFLMGVPYLLIGLAILYFVKSGKFKN